MKIPERQHQLDTLSRKYLTDTEQNGNSRRTSGPPPDLPDDEVVELLRRAKNAAKFSNLYDDGNTSPYDGDESRADLALMSMFGFYSQDSAQLERLFDSSVLGQRPKWKNRPDYRRRTVDKALRELRDTYTPAQRKQPPTNPDSDFPPPGSNGHGAGYPSERFNLTDMGNAERFVARHGRDMRYCYPWAKWLVWAGSRWERDNAGRVHRLAKETVRSIYGEAAAAEDEGARKAIAQHATRSEAEAKIKAMLELAKSEVPISPDELDADPWLFNTPNGTVDLRTGELRTHRREDRLTKMAGAEYQPDTPAPAWGAFLERVLPSKELRAFVQRAAGYSTTGDTSEQVMFINHGAGANGKSTYQEVLAEALGDYAMRAPTEMLMVKRAGGIPNDVARLKGARFVSASETEEGRRLAESLVKDLTGQDTITARFMRAEFFDFKPSHKLWLSTNHKPEIRGTDNAIWRRIRLVPWSVTIPPAERDRKLPEKLRQELAGVLAWAVQGCMKWRREGLGEPEEVRTATAQYRAEQDVLATFLAECCVVTPEAWAKFADLYDAYAAWCEESGETAETKRRFGNRLAERGFAPLSGAKNVAIRRGLALRSDRNPDPDRQKVNPGHEGVNEDNSQKPRKFNEKGTWVNEGYPQSYITESSPSYEEVYENNVKQVNPTPLINPDGGSGAERFSAPRQTRRLTEEEAQRVQKLIYEGMAPAFARAAVLKEGGTA